MWWWPIPHNTNTIIIMTCVRTTALLLLSVCSADNTITNTEYRKQYERSLASKTYCPPDKSGRVPTEACNGFVECIKGIQGNNRFDCAPGTIFDVAEDTCNWPDAVTDCSPFIAYADGQATDAYVNSTNNYCPPEYTGRAPTSRCVGKYGAFLLLFCSSDLQELTLLAPTSCN